MLTIAALLPSADTNCNGKSDGEEDSNHNGRFDAGETDPVMGFYKKGDNDFYCGGGELFLLYDSDTPMGKGYYGEFDFNGSSLTGIVNLSIENQGNIIISPNTLDLSITRHYTVKIFVPESEDTSNRNIYINGNIFLKLITPSPFCNYPHIEDEYNGLDDGLWCLTQRAPNNPLIGRVSGKTYGPGNRRSMKVAEKTTNQVNYPTWIVNNYIGNPPAPYRAVCVDFAKLGIWRYLGGNIDTRRKANTAQNNPSRWDTLKMGLVFAYADVRTNPYPTAYPNSICVRISGPKNIGDTDYQAADTYRRFPLTDVTPKYDYKTKMLKGGGIDMNNNGIKGISGKLGDFDRIIDWGDLLPGDIFFIDYEDSHSNHQIYDGNADHVIVLVQKPSLVPPRAAIFAWGTYWSMHPKTKTEQLIFEGGYKTEIVREEAKYIVEPMLLPYLDTTNDFGTQYPTPREYREKIEPGGGKIMQMINMNSLDEYLSIESDGKVRTNVFSNDEKSWLRFIIGIRRFTITP